MDTATQKHDFFGKRYTYLGHHDIQLRVGSYILYIAKNLNSINDKLGDVITKGLDENEKCIFLCGEESEEQICSALEKREKNVEELTKHSQFFFITDRKKLFGLKGLSMDTFFCQLQGFIDDTCLQGWSTLRLVVDIQWLLNSSGKSKDFIKKELELFKRFMLKRMPLLFIVYVSSTNLTPKNLLDLTNTHSMILLDENFVSSIAADSTNLDNLTGLFNQRHFKELLQKEIARCTRYKRPCTLVIFDIDDFKHINRQYGFAVGDDLLLEVSDILMKNVRAVDIPGRSSGEEFSVLLPETDKTGAAVMAHRILNVISDKVSIEGEKVTVCAGIAGFPDDCENHNELIQKTQEALSATQKRGRNSVGMAEDSAPRV